MRARAQHCRWSNAGSPNFRCIPFAPDVLLDPGRMAVPRISAPLMLRSTISTVSAPATCPFRGSITNPTQLLCTLRGRRYRRLTQHLLPGGPLRPYPDRSCTGWTAPAFVGAFGNLGFLSRSTAGQARFDKGQSWAALLVAGVPTGESGRGPKIEVAWSCRRQGDGIFGEATYLACGPT